jgi:hypothetical protein
VNAGSFQTRPNQQQDHVPELYYLKILGRIPPEKNFSPSSWAPRLDATSHETYTITMAFKFTWPTFSPSFYETASNLLTSALSKAPTPPIITDNIVVKEFNLGTTPPDLEILEIGELGDDRFRGVFKLKYSGDAFIVLQTKVQVCFPLDRFQFSY